MAVSEDIYSLLIPLEKDRLVVPRATIAEVIRYAPPADADKGEDWFLGSIVWNNLNIPVVSFETFCGAPVSPAAGRTRIVVFRPVTDADAQPYGIVAQGFPQMVRVSREVLETDNSFRVPEGAPIISRVQILQEQALIPDLDLIEESLTAMLAST